jgi:hypothetical protein
MDDSAAQKAKARAALSTLLVVFCAAPSALILFNLVSVYTHPVEVYDNERLLVVFLCSLVSLPIALVAMALAWRVEFRAARVSFNVAVALALLSLMAFIVAGF